MAVSGKVRCGKRGVSAMATDMCACKCTRIELLCRFAVPELLKSALVLVLVLGVLATHLILAFLWAP